jgi:L-seryl-tRNA(Ser) seleniumtransferase
LSKGSDLVCFSGDKLLGGPQAGVIVGRKVLVAKLRKNPLMRALRVDKLTYSALEWTLMEYEKGRFQETLPTWRFLALSKASIRERGQSLLESLQNPLLNITLEEGHSLTGGGSAPEEGIETWLLTLQSETWTPNQIERKLRGYDPPILCRIEEDRVLIDLRTVFPEEDRVVAEALGSLFADKKRS